MDKLKILDFDMLVPQSNTDGIFMKLRNLGIWEKEITDIAKEQFPKTETFIDIGANIGYYTLLAKSQNVKYCYAFEPKELNFNILEENVKLNDYSNCFLYDIGLGNEEGELHFGYNDTKSGHGSFLNNVKSIQNLDKNITKKVKKLDNIEIKGNSIGIKLDVEGFELQVLEGMSKLFQSGKIKFMLIEISRKFYGIEVESSIINILKDNFDKLNVIESNSLLTDTLPGFPQYNILATK